MLSLGWGAVVVAGGWCLRPRSRIVALVGPRSSPSGSRARLGGLAAGLGGWVLARLGRPAGELAARRVGFALVAGTSWLVVLPWASPVAAALGWAVPGWSMRRAEARRLRAAAADLPEVVDLLVLAVGSGANVHQAVSWVAGRTRGAVAGELARCRDEAGRGRRLADALDEVPARAGEALRPLVGALAASERYGAPLGASLERLADEVRRERRRAAEEAARKVPVKLLFPLVTCTLPAFALLTVAPLVASAVRSLQLGP